ncbi:hypothetical protein AGMMS4956_06710 [Bacteroidia bacterium]|nr:hypothetical protein AGMMS4956_06710 [Bacteroidia bacterium]
MKTKKLLLCVAAGALLVSCAKEKDKTLSVDTNTITANKEAGTYKIAVTSNTEWSVFVDDATWYEIYPLRGSDNGNIYVVIQNNPTDTDRNVTINIQTTTLKETITLTQEGIVVPENGVLVDGVVWAKTNVDAFGTFAATPDALGRSYQFNDTVGYKAVSQNGVTWTLEPEWKDVEWEKMEAGYIWQPDKDPCPTGWRIPTGDEVWSLANSSATFYSAVDGWFFGPNSASATWSDFKGCVFLPIIVKEIINGDVWTTTGEYAYGNYGIGYWASNAISINDRGYMRLTNLCLYYDHPFVMPRITTPSKYAFSIRCVKE